jgi:hypothetical protein
MPMGLGSRASRAVVVLMALCTGSAAVAVRSSVSSERSAMPDDADVLYVPESTYLRPMSLGYREALADLLWVRALVFSGVSLGNTDVEAIQRYADAISGLAPRFPRVYQWGGVTAVYGGSARVERRSVDIGIAIYRDGLAQFPEDHTLLYGLGMMLTHQVSSTPGYSEEERAAAKEEGTRLIRRAAAFGADPLVRQYAATLVSEGAESALARQFLESELAQAEDADYQRMLRKKLREIGAGASVESVERIRKAFVDEQTRQAPYLPDAVFALVRDDATRSPAD